MPQVPKKPRSMKLIVSKASSKKAIVAKKPSSKKVIVAKPSSKKLIVVKKPRKKVIVAKKPSNTKVMVAKKPSKKVIVAKSSDVPRGAPARPAAQFVGRVPRAFNEFFHGHICSDCLGPCGGERNLHITYEQCVVCGHNICWRCLIKHHNFRRLGRGFKCGHHL